MDSDLRHVVALVALGLLAAVPNFASAQNCIQRGNLPEGGAINCTAHVLTQETYLLGQISWGATATCAEAQTEQALFDCAAAQIQRSGGVASKCFVRHEPAGDWFMYRNGGRAGWAPGNDSSRVSRLFGKNWQSVFDGYDANLGRCDPLLPKRIQGWEIRRRQVAECPTGRAYYFEEVDGTWVCGDPIKLQCPRPGNPIDLATGSKHATEVQIADAHTGLQLVWHYDSQRQQFIGATTPVSTAPPGILAFADRVWRHNFDKVLLHEASAARASVRIVRPEGDVYFARSGSAWVRSRYVRTDSLTEQANSLEARWVYLSEQGSVETYNSAGLLVRVAQPNGRTLSLDYVNGHLERVRDAAGRYLRFEHEADGRMSAIVTSAGDRYTTLFDPSTRTLQFIGFPDGSRRSYLYEASYRQLLTGVIDELGHRIATYSYDSTQRPISTERANGADRFVVGYTSSSNGAPMTVTGPNAATATVNWRPAGAQLFPWYYSPAAETLSGVSAAVPGLEHWWQQSESDVNGNIMMRRGFDGTVTRSSFKLARNLETARVTEGVSGGANSCPSGAIYYSATYGSNCVGGTCWAQSPFAGSVSGASLGYSGWYYACPIPPATALIESRTWHPDWNLQIQTARSNAITTILYNGQTHNGQAISCAPSTAQLAGKPLPLACWVIEQPTADANGSQGFNAAPSGDATVTRATYNANGQVLLHERYDNVTPVASATPTALPGMQAPALRRTYAYAAATDASFTRDDLQTLTLEWPSQSPPPPAQTTSFRKYNKRGQVLEFQSPDGSVSTLTYHARGWLNQYSVLPAGGNLQTTRYAYDAAGQLKKATLPDGSFVSFGYDGAQRLTLVADSSGNSITYTLNNASRLTGVATIGSYETLVARQSKALDPYSAAAVDALRRAEGLPPLASQQSIAFALQALAERLLSVLLAAAHAQSTLDLPAPTSPRPALPGPFDILFPGTPTNQRFVDATTRLIDKICRNLQGPEHRGRIQAQGGGYEDSEPWGWDRPPTAAEGEAMLNSLVARMLPREYRARRIAIDDARIWIRRAGAAGGVRAEVRQTFNEPGARAGERIDVEVRKGIAFVP